MLANALCQALQRRKVNRVRQQAGSYRLVNAAKLMVFALTPSRLKPVPLDARDFTVGAGLLANAFCQARQQRKVNRVRQQAGSYRSIRPRLARAAK